MADFRRRQMADCGPTWARLVAASHLSFRCDLYNMPMRRWIVILGLALVLLVGGFAWSHQHSSAASDQFLTATVSRGTVAQTVAATGTVAPTQTISLSFGSSGSASASSSSSSSAS